MLELSLAVRWRCGRQSGVTESVTAGGVTADGVAITAVGVMACKRLVSDSAAGGSAASISTADWWQLVALLCVSHGFIAKAGRSYHLSKSWGTMALRPPTHPLTSPNPVIPAQRKKGTTAAQSIAITLVLPSSREHIRALLSLAIATL